MSNEWTGLPSNGLLLCASCHHWIEKHREAARDAGWLVPYGTDPATVPVLVDGGRVVLLDPAGHYERATPVVEVPVRAGMVSVAW